MTQARQLLPSLHIHPDSSPSFFLYPQQSRNTGYSHSSSANPPLHRNTNILPCHSDSREAFNKAAVPSVPALTPDLFASFPVVHELTRVSLPLLPRPQVSPDPEVPDLLFTIGRLELGSFAGAVKPEASAEDSCFGPSPAWLTREDVARS